MENILYLKIIINWGLHVILPAKRTQSFMPVEDRPWSFVAL